MLDAASLKAAFTPVKMPFWERAAWAILSNDRGMGYGFGWIVCRHRGLREIWHNGGLHGFRGCLLRVPDEKFTVVVLANALPGRRKADSDPRLQSKPCVRQGLGILPHASASRSASKKLSGQLLAYQW